MLIHLGPKADQVKRAVQPHLVFGALNEHDVAIARAADTFIADGLARDLHCRSATPGGEDRVRGL